MFAVTHAARAWLRRLTGARCLDPPSNQGGVSVKPTQGGDIAIGLTVRAGDDPDAVCTVNGGGIMLHAERPGGPVAAAQK